MQKIFQTKTVCQKTNLVQTHRRKIIRQIDSNWEFFRFLITLKRHNTDKKLNPSKIPALFEQPPENLLFEQHCWGSLVKMKCVTP